MIEIEKREIPLCCGKKQQVFKINHAIMKEDLAVFIAAGFSHLKNFYKSGILFIEDEGISANCPFGGNELHIRSKGKEYANSLLRLEETLKKLA